MAFLQLMMVIVIVASFTEKAYSFDVVENGETNKFVGQVHPSDAVQSEYSFGGPASNAAICRKFFSIDYTSGVITTNGTLDREKVYEETSRDVLDCVVVYTSLDSGNPEIEQVTITILDINDEIPRFYALSQPHNRNISISVRVPVPVIRLEPVDRDKGENGTFEFSITSGNQEGYFTIQRALGDSTASTTRILNLVRTSNFGQQVVEKSFTLTITIHDMGNPSLSFEQVINVYLLNIPHEPPTFPVTSILFPVREDQSTGSEHQFGNVTASNTAQVYGDIFYTLSPDTDNFQTVNDLIGVGEISGRLFLKQRLDCEGSPLYQRIGFYVDAFNPGINAGDNVYVEVTCKDVNDEYPEIVDCHGCRDGNVIDIVEHSNSSFSFSIVTQDGDKTIDFKHISDDIEIVSSNDHISTINTSVANFQSFSLITFTIDPLDRELSPNFTLNLNLSNSAEPYLSVTTAIHVNVLDINDNAPTFTQDVYLIRVAEGAPVGKDVITIEALDEDEGKNGNVTYSIESVDPLEAQTWFYLSSNNGTLSIASGDINYNVVSGRVRLTLTATDGGDVSLSSTAALEIEISPTITFSPNSYVEYDQFDVVDSNEYSIYLEMRTKRTEGIVFFQYGVNPSDIVSLEIREGFLHYQHGPNYTTNTEMLVTDNKWYSVSIERQREGGVLRLQVWETLSQVNRVTELLMDAVLLRCDNSTSNDPSQANSLYIGGVDLFSLSDDARPMSTEFIGTIRNVVIDGTQVDLGCPTSEMNVIQGFHSSNACDESTFSCENAYTTTCVDYAPEPYCQCLGGFPPQSCQPIQDTNIPGGEDSYAPIRFHGNSKADIELDYSFFSDLELQKRKENPTAGQKRKRRAVNDTTVQTIEITFRPVDVGRSVLLYSKRGSVQHILKISEASEQIHAVVYIVTNHGNDIIHVAQQIRLQNMTSYPVTLTIGTEMATLSILSNGEHLSISRTWGNNDYSTFVQQPSTTLTIGGPGAEDPVKNLGYFKGCISRVAIDSIEIPLSGLLSLTPEDGGFTTGANTTEQPEVYCDLCDVTTCQTSATCVRSVSGEPRCECQAGTILVGSQCEVLPSVGVTGPVVPEPLNSTPYIIGGSVGAAGLIIIIVLVIVFTRACHKKRDRQKRTYSVSNMNVDIPNGHSQSSRPNAYVHVQPRGDDHTTLDTANCVSRHDRGSSVSTYQEHAEDADPEIETPHRYSRRKSTISAESGIKTDTEASLRSIPRMDDSGNEKETDYSEGDSASDDLSSTCFMQNALSPVGINLVGSSNSITAVASTVSPPQTPLTPKERQVITPLRPASTCLSEVEDNKEGRDNDLDRDRVFTYSHTLPTLSRNSSTRQSGRRGSDSENSRVSSSCSGSKWYKSSTASDTERERERSKANKAYYTQQSEPLRYPLPPDYHSPPSFPERKNETPIAYPNTRRSRVPMHITDSPLSRDTNKYENFQLPYANAPVRDPRLRYDNHRLQQHHMLPNGTHNRVDDHGLTSMKSKPTSVYQTQRQHSLGGYTGHYHTMGPGSTYPTHILYQHSRSYSNEDKNKREPEQQFQDLKSVSTINPIAYWEMQDRMKTAVDQVDPYQILSEPYIQFEDVSTDPSVIESQITQDQEHQSFCSQGGGEDTADVIGQMNLSLSLQDDIDSTTVTGTEPEMGPRITHFPSADCSSQYTPTLVDSSSGSSTPKTPNVFALSHSQYQFDV